MSGRSRDLSIAEVMPGMVLGGDLLDDCGVTLLPKGTEVTESLLASLRRREVDALPIFVEEERSDLDDEALREAVHARLIWLFRRDGQSEADRILREAVFAYCLGRGA